MNFQRTFLYKTAGFVRKFGHDIRETFKKFSENILIEFKFKKKTNPIPSQHSNQH
jgi:hypothetical protein